MNFTLHALFIATLHYLTTMYYADTLVDFHSHKFNLTIQSHTGNLTSMGREALPFLEVEIDRDSIPVSVFTITLHAYCELGLVDSDLQIKKISGASYKSI